MKKHERSLDDIAKEAAKLKAWRKRLDLSQEQAGELLGVDPRTIKRWEKNGPPQLGRIIEFACKHAEAIRKD